MAHPMQPSGDAMRVEFTDLIPPTICQRANCPAIAENNGVAPLQANLQYIESAQQDGSYRWFCSRCYEYYTLKYEAAMASQSAEQQQQRAPSGQTSAPGRRGGFPAHPQGASHP